MDKIDKFFEEEKNNSRWFEHLITRNTRYYFVKDINTTLPPYTETQGDYSIKSSIFHILFNLLPFLFLLFFWFIYLLLVVSKIILPISLSFFLLTTYILIILIRFYLSPKNPYKITFSTESLLIGKEIIEWYRITDYLIIEHFGGKGRKISNLVLFLDNGEIVKKSLINLNISGKLVLKLIELYKHKYSTTVRLK